MEISSARPGVGAVAVSGFVASSLKAQSINLIIGVESQIGGISRQQLSAKAADLKMSVNLARLAAHYFYKLTFSLPVSKSNPRVFMREITSAVMKRSGTAG